MNYHLSKCILRISTYLFNALFNFISTGKFRKAEILSELRYLAKMDYTIPDSMTLEEWKIFLSFAGRSSRNTYLDSLVFSRILEMDFYKDTVNKVRVAELEEIRENDKIYTRDFPLTDTEAEEMLQTLSTKLGE